MNFGGMMGHGTDKIYSRSKKFEMISQYCDIGWLFQK